MYSMECKLNVMMFNARSESWYVLFSPARIQLINLNENLWQTRKKETKRKEKRMRGAAKINTMFKCDTRRHTHQMRSPTYLNAREIKVEEKSTHITLWDTQSKRTHTVNIDCSSDNRLMYQHLYDFYLGYWLPIWEGGQQCVISQEEIKSVFSKKITFHPFQHSLSLKKLFSDFSPEKLFSAKCVFVVGWDSSHVYINLIRPLFHRIFHEIRAKEVLMQIHHLPFAIYA